MISVEFYHLRTLLIVVDGVSELVEEGFFILDKVFDVENIDLFSLRPRDAGHVGGWCLTLRYRRLDRCGRRAGRLMLALLDAVGLELFRPREFRLSVDRRS